MPRVVKLWCEGLGLLGGMRLGAEIDKSEFDILGRSVETRGLKVVAGGLTGAERGEGCKGVAAMSGVDELARWTAWKSPQLAIGLGKTGKVWLEIGRS